MSIFIKQSHNLDSCVFIDISNGHKQLTQIFASKNTDKSKKYEIVFIWIF